MENTYSIKKDDKKNINDEYDLYEKRQIFLDNVNIKNGSLLAKYKNLC